MRWLAQSNFRFAPSLARNGGKPAKPAFDPMGWKQSPKPSSEYRKARFFAAMPEVGAAQASTFF